MKHQRLFKNLTHTNVRTVVCLLFVCLTNTLKSEYFLLGFCPQDASVLWREDFPSLPESGGAGRRWKRSGRRVRRPQGFGRDEASSSSSVSGNRELFLLPVQLRSHVPNNSSGFCWVEMKRNSEPAVMCSVRQLAGILQLFVPSSVFLFQSRRSSHWLVSLPFLN